MTLFGSFAASDAESDGEAQRVDDRGTISGGALVPMGPATVALEYTTRSDQLPWRLDGAALITPSLTVHGARWEFAFGTPIGIGASAHRPGLGFHLIREF